MKLALLGRGKTGSFVEKLANEQKIEVEVFHSSHKPTLESLNPCDMIISFLPGEAFQSYIDLLVESKKIVITGSTGFEYPADFKQRINENKSLWVTAHNFSLGMSIIKKAIEQMKSELDILGTPQLSIYEKHHVKKLDAPSGTALSWQSWLAHKTQIHSDREGDEIGYHELTITTALEQIKISHQSLDRSLFANGALWVAKLVYQKELTGFYTLEEIIQWQKENR